MNEHADIPPSSLPIFPLSGALLLPHARLPLNVFEDRYLAMIEDVLAEGRIMGMVQPLDAVESRIADDAPVYGVGCAGRLTSFSETDDGRFLITLSGLSRFRIVREIEGRNGYRRWDVDFGDFESDFGGGDASPIDRDGLMALARAFFDTQNAEVDWDAVAEAEDAALVTALAISCPFAPAEKQALLEAKTTAERAATLAMLLEMAIRVGTDAPFTTHN